MLQTGKTYSSNDFHDCSQIIYNILCKTKSQQVNTIHLQHVYNKINK